MSGALIKTELGICPSARIALETLTTAPGSQTRELQAAVVRTNPGELAVEWLEPASTGASAMFGQATLTGGSNGVTPQVNALGRVHFCALAPAERQRSGGGFS